MLITAILPIELYFDGSFEEFTIGIEVKTAFQLFYPVLEKSEKAEKYFKQRFLHEYEFSGEIIDKINCDEKYSNCYYLVIQTDNSRFFLICEYSKINFEKGMYITGVGQLCLDPGFWAVFDLDENYFPNLFYKLKVTKIIKVVYTTDRRPYFAVNAIENNHASLFEAANFSILPGELVDFIIEMDTEDMEDKDIPITYGRL